MKSLFNYKGIQFGPVKEMETSRGYHIQVDMFYNNLFVGKYNDEGMGGYPSFDVFMPTIDDKNYFQGMKLKFITEDDCIAWTKSMKNTLLNLAKEYLKSVTDGDGYTGFCGENIYLKDDSKFESFMIEFCETYVNGLAMIEKNFKKGIRDNKTTEIIAIIIPEYIDDSEDTFMLAFKTHISSNPKIYNSPREELSKVFCEKYNVKKVFFVTLSDFVIVEAGVKNAKN